MEDMNPILRNIYEQPDELTKVLDNVTGPQLDTALKISKLIQVSHEVILTSMGSALYSLMPMYEALIAKGIRNVRLVETAELLRHPERAPKDAFYLLMSRSGESREVADFSVWLHDNGYLSACITMTPDSTMAKNCTISLRDIASYDQIVCIKAYSSMALCGLVLVELLENASFDKKKAETLHAAFAWMQAHKEEILSQFKSIDFLARADSFYLISRDEGINMMKSASLWIEETAKIPANVMSIDNLYHGPMELIRAQKITKSKTVPILLDIFPDSRSEMIWNYIQEATSDSIYVGTNSNAKSGFSFILPDLKLDGPWMMLVEAMYFQILSYQLALVNGIEPGMFFEDGWIVL